MSDLAEARSPVPSLLRDRSGVQRVTNIELFFNLVYVFAATQLSHYLPGHPDPRGALQTGPGRPGPRRPPLHLHLPPRLTVPWPSPFDSEPGPHP